MTNWSKADRKEAHLTCYQGDCVTTYARLVELFGKPHIIGGDKTNAEWIIKINGLIATIYDYKEPITPTDDYAWHVGGNKKLVVELVNELVAA